MPEIRNPYVGPRPFTRAEAELFFGREREGRELTSLVISQRQVLFYAPSGAGKSSLINTRLTPGLEAAGFVVLPVTRVGGSLPDGIGPVDNIYLFNLMLSLDQGGRDPNRLAHLSLSQFLARLTSDGQQFYYDEQAQPPAEPNTEQPYVLIIDQFEELLTTNITHWKKREAFFKQLEAAMAHDPMLWVVLSLREDFIAPLEPYAPLLTGKMRARFYMQRMGHEAALQAVVRPLAQQGLYQFASDIAEALVDDLRRIRVQQYQPTAGEALGQFVEPVQLQLVCYQLWERLQNQHREV